MFEHISDWNSREHMKQFRLGALVYLFFPCCSFCLLLFRILDVVENVKIWACEAFSQNSIQIPKQLEDPVKGFLSSCRLQSEGHQFRIQHEEASVESGFCEKGNHQTVLDSSPACVYRWKETFIACMSKFLYKLESFQPSWTDCCNPSNQKNPLTWYLTHRITIRRDNESNLAKLISLVLITAVNNQTDITIPVVNINLCDLSPHGREFHFFRSRPFVDFAPCFLFEASSIRLMGNDAFSVGDGNSSWLYAIHH